MAAAITQDLGRFVAGTRFADLPAAAVEAARLGITDCIGVMIAGRREPAPTLLLETLDPAPGEASVLFGPRRAAAADAAWINGTAAHVLDFDDVALRGHPSSVVAPAILAEAEGLDASGERMLAAWAVAYEVWAELAWRDADPHHLKGWHFTGWMGAVAAAAACASLRRLPAERAALALSIAASQGAGLMAANGTMTKPLHAGRAAQAGLVSARLADAGFSAAPDGLEHPFGLLHAISPKGRVDVETPVSAGAPWRVEEAGLSIRRHPVCYVGHRLIDGMLEIVERTGVRPDDVAEIRASLGASMTDILRYHRPDTAQEAKFSAEFALANALLHGRIALTDLTDAAVGSDAIRGLIARTTVEPHAETPGAADRVSVLTRDGRTLSSGPVTAILGSPARPLSAAAFQAKFAECVAYGSGVAAASEQVARLFERLQSLETMAGARELRGHVL